MRFLGSLIRRCFGQLLSSALTIICACKLECFFKKLYASNYIGWTREEVLEVQIDRKAWCELGEGLCPNSQ